MNYSIDSNGYYGEFGGAYIPEILHRCVSQLQEACRTILPSDDFKREFEDLLQHYVGRPSPLYHARRLSEKYGCKVYLKREDLNHTGAHKINNAVGQMLLARRMGKRRIIAETGAGQHGVAAATVCALAGMECLVFMGKTDIERQHVNVEKMKMLGAQVVPVTSGNATLKDATNEAIRYWCCHPDDTYYLIGSTVGPHPYPQLVAHLQSARILTRNWWPTCSRSSARRLPTNWPKSKAANIPTTWWLAWVEAAMPPVPCCAFWATHGYTSYWPKQADWM